MIETLLILVFVALVLILGAILVHDYHFYSSIPRLIDELVLLRVEVRKGRVGNLE